MQEPKEGYVKVARVEEIQPGSMITVQGIDRVDVCVINLEGKYHAFSNVCTHKGAPLHTGNISNRHLICPWHRAHFRVDDGRGYWPAPRGLRSYEVKIEGPWILVKTSPTSETDFHAP